MAYFSNASEGEVLDNECAHCVLGMGENSCCPVYCAQITFNYDACNVPVARAILNELVKQEDGKYIGCQMKMAIDDAVGP